MNYDIFTQLCFLICFGQRTREKMPSACRHTA
jgi:hypothetical protein